MRISFFSETFLPVHDGVGYTLDALGREMVRSGHEVTLYTARRPNQGARETLESGMQIRRYRSIAVPHYSQYRFGIFPYALAGGRALRKETDLVHIHTPFAAGTTGFLAARSGGLPLVGTFHTDFRAMQGSFPRTWATRAFFRLGGWYLEGLYWRCDVTTAPTTEALTSLRRSFGKDPRGELQVVPNGVDVDRFRPGVVEPDWRERVRAGDRPLVTFLGRLTEDKGVHRFLDALAALPTDLPFQGVVGGGGVEASSVAARIARDRRLRDRVTYIGYVEEEEKPALLSQSEVFVLPSTADTSSVSVLEAMASGCACVVTDRGGPRELVEEGRNGLRVDPSDPRAIAGAIEQLLRDSEQATRFGRTGRQGVQRQFSITRIAEQYLGIYQRALDGRFDAVSDPFRPSPVPF